MKWTDEQVEELIRLYPNHLNIDIAEKVGHSESSVTAKAFALKLRKDRVWMRGQMSKSWFQKGRVPHNKGQKMPEEVYQRVKATMFKKGRVPINWKPIGYERLDKDGYVYIKIADHKKLVLKHRYIWEKTFGPIPEGYNVQFRDGNRQNCDISNLYLISRREQLKTQNSVFARYPKDVQILIQLKGALSRQINKQERND